MLTEAELIKLRYVRVRFVDENTAVGLLIKQNLPVNRFGDYYYISPRQRRMLERHHIQFKT